MAKSKITVTRALAELKTLGERIERTVNERFVGVGIGSKVDGKSVEDFRKEAVANFQKFADLVKRRNELKCALVRSNAVTTVTICDVTYTVAEAIERKNSIQFERMMVQSLGSQLQTATAKVNKANEHAQVSLNTLLGHAVSGSGERKMTESDIEAISKPFREANFSVLVDPLDAYAKVIRMRDEIDQFELNVDFALSEVNATTFIEV